MTATATRLPAFAGSLREGSNRRLAPVLADGARIAGADVTPIKLGDPIVVLWQVAVGLVVEKRPGPGVLVRAGVHARAATAAGVTA